MIYTSHLWSITYTIRQYLLALDRCKLVYPQRHLAAIIPNNNISPDTVTCVPISAQCPVPKAQGPNVMFVSSPEYTL